MIILIFCTWSKLWQCFQTESWDIFLRTPPYKCCKSVSSQQHLRKNRGTRNFRRRRRRKQEESGKRNPFKSKKYWEDGNIKYRIIVELSLNASEFQLKLRLRLAIFPAYPATHQARTVVSMTSLVQGVSEWLRKSLSLLLRLESNLLAKTGEIIFFWLGHFDI